MMITYEPFSGDNLSLGANYDINNLSLMIQTLPRSLPFSYRREVIG
jgi:hypothetical protein